MKKLFLIILVVLVIAAITKPSESSFKNYVKTELKSNDSDNVLTIIVKGISKVQSDLSTKYYDKIFYSTVETTIVDERQKFVGVFNMWFKIN